MADKTNKHIKRERLLDQGVKMLMEQGYHGTGLKEMLETVGVPKGSFYNYFNSKEEFAAQAITHYIEPFLVRLEGHLQNPQLNALAALRLYYSELIIEVSQSDYKSGCLLGNLMGEIGGSSEACHQSLKTAIERYRSLQESALLRGQQEGVVRMDLSALSMSDLLVNNWQGALLRMKIDQSVAALKEFRSTLLDDYFKC
ncbi:MAG: TetR family transcriptional regulator [Methyloprofundus sp.]|nr:TetR family transcriptional regulator [Methyloprofundus sp.]